VEQNCLPQAACHWTFDSYGEPEGWLQDLVAEMAAALEHSIQYMYFVD